MNHNQSPTFHDALTSKVHEDREAGTEDGILTPVEQCKTRRCLQRCFFILGQQLVVALGLVLFIGEVLQTHKHDNVDDATHHAAEHVYATVSHYKQLNSLVVDLRLSSHVDLHSD